MSDPLILAKDMGCTSEEVRLLGEIIGELEENGFEDEDEIRDHLSKCMNDQGIMFGETHGIGAEVNDDLEAKKDKFTDAVVEYLTSL